MRVQIFLGIGLNLGGGAGETNSGGNPGTGFVRLGGAGGYVDVPPCSGKDALHEVLVRLLECSLLKSLEVDVRGDCLAGVTLEASAIAAFSYKAVGEILDLKGSAFRKMSKVVMSELAVSTRPRVSFNALSGKGEGRGNVAVRESATIGTIGRVGFAAPFANARGVWFPVAPRVSETRVLSLPVQFAKMIAAVGAGAPLDFPAGVLIVLVRIVVCWRHDCDQC